MTLRLKFPASMPAEDRPFYRSIVNGTARRYKQELGYNLFSPAIRVEFVEGPLLSVGTDAAQATIHGITIRTKESLYGRGKINPILYKAYLEYYPHEFAHVLLERWYERAGDPDWHRKGWNGVHWAIYGDRSYMRKVDVKVAGRVEALDFPNLFRLITEEPLIRARLPAPDGTGTFV